MTSDTTTPLGIDTTVPTTARMYDFWLGGHDNFAADRTAALAVSEAAPEAPLLARENRKFLRRVVRYLAAEAGISQFLDIGTGLPTQGNVHQVAQAINPDARVVYVDNDRCKSGCVHARWTRRRPAAGSWTESCHHWPPCQSRERASGAGQGAASSTAANSDPSQVFNSTRADSTRGPWAARSLVCSARRSTVRTRPVLGEVVYDPACGTGGFNRGLHCGQAGAVLGSTE